jgi:hypothetical protein
MIHFYIIIFSYYITMGGRFNSHIYTNSLAMQNSRAYFGFFKGDSFYGLSKPQYSSQVYHQLANLGPGGDSRASRWERANGNTNKQFIPPVVR